VPSRNKKLQRELTVAASAASLQQILSFRLPKNRVRFQTHQIPKSLGASPAVFAVIYWKLSASDALMPQKSSTLWSPRPNRTAKWQANAHHLPNRRVVQLIMSNEIVNI
jgi:hypothetical protein